MLHLPRAPDRDSVPSCQWQRRRCAQRSFPLLCHDLDVDLTSIQLAYDRALHRLLADLDGVIDPQPTVAVDFTSPDDLPYLFSDGSSVHQCWLPWTADIEEATVHLVDPLQADVLEELWGRAWPSCRSSPSSTIMRGRRPSRVGLSNNERHSRDHRIHEPLTAPRSGVSRRPGAHRRRYVRLGHPALGSTDCPILPSDKSRYGALAPPSL